jgi:hypothetical protein
MGDAGEGLVDAQSRLQELMEERSAARRPKKREGEAVNPERLRLTESLRLAAVDLKRQQSATQNPVRLEQIKTALAALEKRLAEL